MSISGGSHGGTVPAWGPSVTVSTTTTLGSGGGADWWGRCSIKRRPSDNALVMAYYRSTGHANNDGNVHIKMSDDDGATWTAEDTDLDGNPIADITPSYRTGSQDAGEPWLYVCPNGDLIIHTWVVDYGTSGQGTCQFRSTDGGTTWNEEGPVSWVNGVGLSASQTFQTDDDFIFNQTIYAGIRTYSSNAETDCFMSLVSSSDNGLTWDYISDITTAAEVACIEVGLEYVGQDTIVCMIRDIAHTASYKRVSTDMGLTWGSLTNVTSLVGIAARQRVYTISHLKGLSGWWKDPRLAMVGFIQTDPGNSQGRRNAVWFSPDRGTTWSGPHYTDSDVEDAGYGDLFIQSDGQFTQVSYQGTLTAASLKQYDLTVDLAP